MDYRSPLVASEPGGRSRGHGIAIVRSKALQHSIKRSKTESEDGFCAILNLSLLVDIGGRLWEKPNVVKN